MRSAGFVFATLLIAASVVSAQTPVPGQPVQPVQPAQPTQPLPPAAPPAKAADPELDKHLNGWQKKMGDVTSFRTKIAVKKTDGTFKRDKNYTGEVLSLKPNYAILRIENAADQAKTDFESYICDGKSLFVYEGSKRTVTEIPLQKDQAADNLMLEFLGGMKADVAKARFDISIFKTDEHYIFLDVKPLRPADQREFRQLRMALYGPGPKTEKFAYLPAQVFMLKPNGDSEDWKFSETQLDIPGLKPEHFKYVELKGWKLEKFQQPANNGGVAPAGGALPAGGVVRPNQGQQK